MRRKETVISNLEQSRSYAAYCASPYRSIKHSSYFAAYDELFGSYFGKPITFVEIGVLDGGSLFMWRELFGPDARIIGVELNPGAKKWEKDGFEIYCGSQSDREFWKHFITEVGPIDVALDDGGHTFEQQIITTECLLPQIKDGGILAVEDTHTSYMESFGGPSPASFVEFAKNIVDGVNYRFGKLSGRTHERIVHSVQFFESIIAFKVDRGKAVSSHQVDNGKPGFGAHDYRHGAAETAGTAGGLTRRIAKLVPFAKPVAKVIRRKRTASKLRAQTSKLLSSFKY